VNERIQELALQAGLVGGGYANGTKIMTWRESFDNPGSLEKFAELIVQKCASIVYRTCEDGDAGAQAILYEFDIDDAKSQK
jgi:hypothetical protein